MNGEILVVGGAGFIGSHMVKCLARAGWTPVVLDDLSTGHRDAVGNSELIVGSLATPSLLEDLFAYRQFTAVMHFAGLTQVAASVRDPARFLGCNVRNSRNLLRAMRRLARPRLVFSSSAAIFGDSEQQLIAESHRCAPINPYGLSKLMVEAMIDDFCRAHGLSAICLRYFNAAGCDPEALLGECHEPETHLIPLVLRAACGRLPHVAVHGSDYPTADGTCIRDYVHVVDLCEAHLRALERLQDGRGNAKYNLGSGCGHSVREVIAAARRVTGCAIPSRDLPRRPGDPPRLVANPGKALSELGWQPRRGALDTIIADAWRWERTGRHVGPRALAGAVPC